MLNFNAYPASIIANIIEAFTSAINIFLIFLIYKHSPQVMNKLKYYMLKMAIVDLMVSISCVWLFRPNLLYPFPAVTCGGLLKDFGLPGLKIGYILAISTVAMTLVSADECCSYRTFVFYEMERCVERITTFPEAIFWSSLFNGIPFAFSVIFISYGSMTYEDFVDFAGRHNFSSQLNLMPPDTAFVMFNFDNVWIIIASALMALFLLLVEALNILFSILVMYKINQIKSSMCTETFKLQKSLTVVLFMQLMIPIIAVAIPAFSFIVGRFFHWNFSSKSDVLQWTMISAIGLYPLFNSLFCLVYIKPYREYTAKQARRILFWGNNVDTEIISANPSNSDPSAWNTSRHLV